MIRVQERLKVVVPMTLVLIWLLMYMNTKSAVKTMIVLLAVPFSIIGAVWFLYLLGYNLSIAVWVGIIALMGLDAETGVFMLLFLDLSYDEAKAKGLLRNRADLTEAIIHGAVKRVRPKAMTVFAATFGLIPIMWSVGAGADVMKRIAAPDGRRPRHVVRSRAPRLPGRLHALEGAKPPEVGSGSARSGPRSQPRPCVMEIALRADAARGEP